MPKSRLKYKSHCWDREIMTGLWLWGECQLLVPESAWMFKMRSRHEIFKLGQEKNFPLILQVPDHPCQYLALIRKICAHPGLIDAFVNQLISTWFLLLLFLSGGVALLWSESAQHGTGAEDARPMVLNDGSYIQKVRTGIYWKLNFNRWILYKNEQERPRGWYSLLGSLPKRCWFFEAIRSLSCNAIS